VLRYAWIFWTALTGREDFEGDARTNKVMRKDASE
jgi:hypothetical protein